ncbi:MAG: enoyl-CoA hydratase/isomerase family protein [Rhodocyclaceae bacterium]|jgi:enoyl-CoA hydratase/carnithine racemase|nr:enoyl-CoA hydratase/isomerase family protein [Rhodocyclaceae bacterium]
MAENENKAEVFGTPEQCIILERDGNVAILTLRNPARRNAFTKDMRRTLTAKLFELQTDPTVRAIVLTGAEGHFCSGADVSKLGPMEMGPLDYRVWLLDTNTLLRTVADGVKPIICAIEGDCIGAGFSLALLCDFMIVSKKARLGAFFAKIGLLPDMGIMYTLQRRVGMAQMRKMLMFAEPVSGEDGEKIGLADELVEPGQALAVAKQWAAGFDNVAPLVLGGIRVALRNGINSVDDAIRAEQDLQPYMSGSADLKEGMKAFFEKRKPQFIGR